MCLKDSLQCHRDRSVPNATGTGHCHHSFCISPRPTPVSRSSCLWEAPLAFNSFSTLLFDSSSSFWKALLLVKPVISIIIRQTWSSDGLPLDRGTMGTGQRPAHHTRWITPLTLLTFVTTQQNWCKHRFTFTVPKVDQSPSGVDFVEPAHARDNSNKFGPLLAYSQSSSTS